MGAEFWAQPPGEQPLWMFLYIELSPDFLWETAVPLSQKEI